MAELTPMKRQYYEIKQQYQDCLLFFRLGDFYEMFDDDARLASKLLDLALTTRDRSVENPDERTPMCGIPYHSAETYIARLIAKGYKVAICEQTEDPALAKGLVQRDVIRIITPGTVTESSMLDEHRSNYISAVYLNNGHAGVSFCDVSTGEFCCAGIPPRSHRQVRPCPHPRSRTGGIPAPPPEDTQIYRRHAPASRRAWSLQTPLSRSSPQRPSTALPRAA